MCLQQPSRQVRTTVNRPHHLRGQAQTPPRAGELEHTVLTRRHIAPMGFRHVSDKIGGQIKVVASWLIAHSTIIGHGSPANSSSSARRAAGHLVTPTADQ